MTSTKRITDFRVTWTADHAQYFQGHGIALTDYTHCATGCGETLREAYHDALEQLCEQDAMDCPSATYLQFGLDSLASLTSQVKEPEMLDWDVVKGYCPESGKHYQSEECFDCNGAGCDSCNQTGTCTDAIAQDPDCAVCAGEWHFYVMVDVQVSEGE